MGIEVIAGLAVGLGAFSAYEGYESRQDAKEAANRSFQEQVKAQNEQRAMNAQQQAQEQRQQIREERIRRARVLQAAANTGTTGSSGESGALGSLSTQLASNLGFNASKATLVDNMSIFNQNAANYNMQSQSSMITAQNYDQLFGLSMQTFSAAGGVKAFKTK